MATMKNGNGASTKKRHVDSDMDANSEDEGYSTSSSYAPSAIDVSFNYVGLTEIDFMALKRLAQQLYHTHATELDIGALAEHVIKLGSGEGNPVGTVVKVEDDEDGDPFAFASAVDLSLQQTSSSTATKTLRTYYDSVLNGKDSNSSAKAIKSILDSEHVVQIFHERMINLPPQIMPPLYRMLFDEIRASTSSLSQATHFLFFSRAFNTEALDEGEEEDESAAATSSGASKKNKGKKMKKTLGATIKNQAIAKVAATEVGAGSQAEEMGLFHPEDALIAKLASHTFTFRFPAVKDSDDNFNAPMFGRIALIKNDAKLIDTLLDQVSQAFALPA